MKKLLLFVSFFGILNAGFSQSEKYMKAMEQLVPAIDTTHSFEGLADLASRFERIANAEKSIWLPYYYAALCNVNMANMYFVQQQVDKMDAQLDKAEPLMNKAEELEKNNSEIYCLIKMYNSGRMMVDPMNRYMTNGTAANEALELAKHYNPENPRVYLLEGQDKYYTPEQYGGSKEEAKTLFELAKKKFETYKPADAIQPTWGMGQLNYFLSLQKGQ